MLLQRARTRGREHLLCEKLDYGFGNDDIQCTHHVVQRVVWKSGFGILITLIKLQAQGSSNVPPEPRL